MKTSRVLTRDGGLWAAGSKVVEGSADRRRGQPLGKTVHGAGVREELARGPRRVGSRDLREACVESHRALGCQDPSGQGTEGQPLAWSSLWPPLQPEWWRNLAGEEVSEAGVWLLGESTGHFKGVCLLSP